MDAKLFFRVIPTHSFLSIQQVLLDRVWFGFLWDAKRIGSVPTGVVVRSTCEANLSLSRELGNSTRYDPLLPTSVTGKSPQKLQSPTES